LLKAHRMVRKSKRKRRFFYVLYLDHGDSHVKREHSLSEKKSLTSKINLFIYLSIFISFRIIFRKNKNKRN